MMAGPLVVLETPLADHHLVPTAPGAGPRKDRYPVFSSTINAVAANQHPTAARIAKRDTGRREGTNSIASRLLIAKHPPLWTQDEKKQIRH